MPANISAPFRPADIGNIGRVTTDKVVAELVTSDPWSDQTVPSSYIRLVISSAGILRQPNMLRVRVIARPYRLTP